MHLPPANLFNPTNVATGLFTPASLSRCSPQAIDAMQEQEHGKTPSTASALPTDFKQMTFFFDQIDQVTLTKYSTFILKFGGRIAATLEEDQRVTHIVSTRHHHQSTQESIATATARKCILRPRKPSWPAEHAPAAQSSQSQTLPTAMDTAANTGSSFPLHSTASHNTSYQQQLQTANLYTPITSNNNSIPSCFLPSHILPKKNACTSMMANENTPNNSNTHNALSIVPKTAAALCQFAKERGIVLWGKDELRACLLGELKRYENAQAALKASTSGKRLAEYLAEERKFGINAATASVSAGGAVANASGFAVAGQHQYQHYAASINRNAITNLAFYANSSTHPAKHKRACFDQFIAPGTAAATAATPSHHLACKQQFNLQQVQQQQQQHIQVFSSQSLNSAYYTFKHPFVLIEDAKQEFKPIFKEYLTVSEEASSQPSANAAGATTAVANQHNAKQPLLPCLMPKLNLNSPAFSCPFVPVAAAAANSASQQQQQLHNVHSKQHKNAQQQRSTSLKSIIEQRCKKRKAKNAKGKPKAGYCECCFEVYTDMQKHSQTTFHRSFATCEKNYAEIDVVVRSLERPLSFKAPSSPKSPPMLAAKAECEGRNCIQKAVDQRSRETWQSDLLKSPCFRKSLRSVQPAAAFGDSQMMHLDHESHSESDDLMAFLPVKPLRAAAEEACGPQVQQVLNTGMELVGKISSLLQVITDNADRTENDLTVHEILYKK